MTLQPDEYIAIALAVLHANPITAAIVLALLKLLALRSKTTADDKILTWIKSKLGI